MGMSAPLPGEAHRMTLELKGRKTLTQRQYQAYKNQIAKIARKYKAQIKERKKVKIR